MTSDRHGGPPEVPAEVEDFLAAGEAPIVFTLGSAAVLNLGSFFAESAAAAQKLGRRAILVGAELQEDLPNSILLAPSRLRLEQKGQIRAAQALRLQVLRPAISSWAPGGSIATKDAKSAAVR